MIERFKTLYPESWEIEYNASIEKALEIDDLFDRYTYIEKFYIPIVIDYYKQTNNYSERSLYERILRYQKDSFYKSHNSSRILPGIAINRVPSWYWEWYKGHELRRKIIEENRRNRGELWN